MITLDQLQVLSVYSTAGSFEKAAQRLHRAQSAVSYAIKSLEDALGLALLDRSGYRARLTPQGEAILRRAEAVLEQVEALEHVAGELREGAEPELNLLINGMLVGRAGSDLVPMLSNLVTRRFLTRINLQVELLRGMQQAMEARPDLVVSPVGLFPFPPVYEQEVVGSLTMVPVVAAQHPLARIAAPVPMAEVRKHIHLVIASGGGMERPVEPAVIGAETTWNFPDFLTRLEGLRAGLGFAWMPTHLVERDLRSGRLVPLLLTQPMLLTRDIAVLYRRSPPLGRTASFLLELFRLKGNFLPATPQDILDMYATKGRDGRGRSPAGDEAPMPAADDLD